MGGRDTVLTQVRNIPLTDTGFVDDAVMSTIFFSYSHWREGWVQTQKEFKAFIDMEGFWNTANTESKYWICERNI